MSDVTKLLEEATPLPWIANDHEFVFGPDGDSVAKTYSNLALGGDASDNADLIVYAVSHLADYEAAVDALEGLLAVVDHTHGQGEWATAEAARAALARLRESVPA